MPHPSGVREAEVPSGVIGPGLELSRRMCEAARAHAQELSAAISVAVVDAGGHLVMFERMDKAEIAGPQLAVDKAFTAVAHRSATGDLAADAAPGGSLAGLASNGGGRYVVFPGGLPLWSPDGRVVGGVGVSGASAEQDLLCAGEAARLWPWIPTR